jgi:undecaprenyl-diphosphatase
MHPKNKSLSAIFAHCFAVLACICAFHPNALVVISTTYLVIFEHPVNAMDYIANLDRELFFILNGLHASWLDPVMFYVSKTFTSLPLYGFLLYLIIRTFKTQSWVPLLLIALCITGTDRITSGLMKPTFERLRPTHEPMLQDRVHTVKGYTGGKFGFASSHAANTFGVALFAFLLLRTQYRGMGYLFLWAGIVSYTRIYLGVHYPGDILVGAVVGLLWGYGLFLLFSKYQKKRKPESRN